MAKMNFNYSDQTPQTLPDFLLVNSIDVEQFNLFGVKTIYWPLNPIQENYDPVYRDMLSSKQFLEPVEVRSFLKVDEATTHGMTDIGADQVAERNGSVWFNIALIENILGRVPNIGDVVEYLQFHQKFEIFKISKELHKIGRPIRYNCSVRLYQDTAGPSTYISHGN